MNAKILDLAYDLLKSLGIQRMRVLPDHLELIHEFGNQAIIAYGKTEEELVENFYYLYQELNDPE